MRVPSGLSVEELRELLDRENGERKIGFVDGEGKVYPIVAVELRGNAVVLVSTVAYSHAYIRAWCLANGVPEWLAQVPDGMEEKSGIDGGLLG